ncbi:MFS monocarboxylate transporter [Penicillium bovifimosum]|uniref:MFS monocarboxylate transporter n=1 Tax=Penicillium bovifimosum TaxID=126998 RepID=A0A9W9HEE8_9EURO|nr:MFS monocarboxylate transporter [Penicillium bovifimosum]KAJ5145514.1 MFS monocarboxylate transporter [Penicillium bovifimosum]
MDQTRASAASSGSTKNEHSFRAWLTVLGAFSTFFCSVGFINAFGVFQEYYRAHQLSDSSDFDISWIGSFETFALFSGAPLTGLLVDRVGPTMLLIAGSLAMLMAIFMTSLCSQYYQFFLAQAVLLGSSMSLLFCPAIATVSRYFHKNVGLAMGVTVGGSSAGGVIWPIVLNELLNKHGVSFGWTIRIIGFIMLPLLVLAVLTVIPPPKTNHLEEVVPGEGTQQTHEKDIQKKDIISLLKNTTFLLLCAGLAISYLGMFSPFFYATSYAESLGHSKSFAFYLVSIINAASLFGRVLPGVLADHYGHFNLCGLAAMLSGIIALCWTSATSIAGLVIWALSYGLSSGVRITSYPNIEFC